MSGKLGGAKNILAGTLLFAAAAGWSWALLKILPLGVVIAVNLQISFVLCGRLRSMILARIEKIRDGRASHFN